MDARAPQLRAALWLSAISIAWNGAAGSIAVVVALGTGSLSLLGFGADAVIDSAASVALVWRFLVEARQPERAERVERVAERVVGVSLLALALYLVAGSIRSLATQAHPEATFVGVALLLASAVALPPLAFAKYRVASRLGSRALRADSVLTAVAGLLAVISLASLALSDAFGLWWADATAALIVAAIVAREGWAASRAHLAEPPGAQPLVSKCPVRIVYATPWYLEVEFHGNRAKIAADAAVPPGPQPDFLAYRDGNQKWNDGTPMSDEDRDEILGLLPEAGRERGWTVEVLRDPEAEPPPGALRG